MLHLKLCQISLFDIRNFLRGNLEILGVKVFYSSNMLYVRKGSGQNVSS